MPVHLFETLPEMLQVSEAYFVGNLRYSELMLLQQLRRSFQSDCPNKIIYCLPSKCLDLTIKLCVTHTNITAHIFDSIRCVAYVQLHEFQRLFYEPVINRR